MKKLVFLATALLSLGANAQTIHYVKAGGVGFGTSWEDASGDIQAMINAAQEGDQIWIAKGTYKPNRRADNLNVYTPNDRNNAFVLKKNVSLYGGFTGVETTLSQRDWKQNETILSGDFSSNDIINNRYTITNNEENAYHIVISAGDIGNTRLDGFTISGGHTNHKTTIKVNDKDINGLRGGGMYNIDSSPIIANIIFYANSSSHQEKISISHSQSPTNTKVQVASRGGGMYNENSHPIISNVIFNNNISHSFIRLDMIYPRKYADLDSYSYGGGMYNISSNPTMTNIIFENNSSIASVDTFGIGSYLRQFVTTNESAHAGGISNTYSNPVITNAVFKNNIVSTSGASSGGGIANFTSEPIITNATFQGNYAKIGGAISYSLSSHIFIYNSIILGNSSGISPVSNDSTIFNSLIQGVGLDISRRNLDGVNTTQDMVFASVDPNSPDNLRLKAGSPAINRGNNTYNTTPTDLANNHRIANGTIDMGAYEYDSATLSAIEIAKDTTINIFPNPVDTTLNIIAEEQNTALLYNISGQLVKTFAVVKGKNTIEVAHLSKGLYLLKIGNSSVKIIKR